MPNQMRQGRRRVMNKFALSEVSFVDRPAQAPAVADIMKMSDEDLLNDDIIVGKQEDDQECKQRRRRRRRDDPNYEKQRGPREGETFRQFLARMRREEDENMTEDEAREMFNKAGDLVDLFTGETGGHQHAIRIIRRDADGPYVDVGFAQSDASETPHYHQIVRNSDGSFTMSVTDGHTHEIDSEAMNSALVDFVTKQFTAEQRERLAESGEAMPDGSFPIRNGSDLNNAIQAFGRTPANRRRAVANHIRRRARALDMTDRLPDEGVLADLLKSAESSGGSVDNGGNDMSDNPELDALKAENAVLKAVTGLSAVHKSHYDSLDADSQSAFLKMDDTGKDAAVKAAGDANPVIYKSADGEEFRMTDNPRMVAMAKRMDAQAAETEALRKASEDADLTKRAESDLANHPGDLAVRKALLKAVDGIEDEAVRKAANDALKAKSAANAGAFQVVGTDAGVDINKSATDAEDAGAQLNDMARELMKSDSSLTFEQAYVKALQDPANGNITKNLAL